MNEGWQNQDYLILLDRDESFAAMQAYRFDRYLPGYTLIGLKGWDDFIVINASGVMLTVPTLPLDATLAAPFTLTQQPSLHPDARFTAKIKWYLKPLVFGGDPTDPRISSGSRTSNMPSLSSGGTRGMRVLKPKAGRNPYQPSPKERICTPTKHTQHLTLRNREQAPSHLCTVYTRYLTWTAAKAARNRAITF